MSVSQSVHQSAILSVSQPGSQPVIQSVNHIVCQSTIQSVSQSVSQPASQAASQSDTSSACQSVSQSISQPHGQPAIQSTTLSVSQSVSHLYVSQSVSMLSKVLDTTQHKLCIPNFTFSQPAKDNGLRQEGKRDLPHRHA